jgi:hypothetical protein
MANTNNIGYRGISNTGINARLKQALVLIAMMLIGMVLSVFING